MIAAYHEAGHAIMAYIVGWTISSIEMDIHNNELNYARTTYDFNIDLIDNEINLQRRLLCLIGGPVSQALFQNTNQIDIDTLGNDGIMIDNLLTHLSQETKEDIIQCAINDTATILSLNDSLNAVQQIVEILINAHNITSDEFHQIMILNNVTRMDFN